MIFLARNVIKATLKRRPEHRPTMDDLFENYSWFKVDLEAQDAIHTAVDDLRVLASPISTSTADLASPSSESLSSVGSTAISVPRVIRTSATPEPCENQNPDDSDDDDMISFHDATDEFVQPMAYLKVPPRTNGGNTVPSQKRKYEAETEEVPVKRPRFAVPRRLSALIDRLQGWIRGR